MFSFKKLINKFFHKTNNEIMPDNFFEHIKNQKHEIDIVQLENIKKRTAKEIEKFIKTNQFSSAERLMFHLKTFEQEHNAINAGFKYYVFRDDIDEYICEVSKNVVKIIELEKYERKIPEDLIPIIIKAREYFDDLYVLFTDYTGREERKVEAEKRAKDPIVFGTFHSSNNQIWNHRFYYICDWTDEYCDLTLDKFVSQFFVEKNKNVLYTIDEYNVEDLQRRIEEEKANKKTRDNEKLANREEAIKLSKLKTVTIEDFSTNIITVE